MDLVNLLINNIPTILGLAFIAFHAIKGIIQGAVSKIMAIISLIIVIIVTRFLSPLCLQLLKGTEIFQKIPKEYESGVALLISIVLFVVLNIIAHFIIKALACVNDVPVVGGLNRLFGAVFGILEAILYLWILFFIIKVMNMVGIPVFSSLPQYIESTPWLKSIYDFNPLSIVAGII